MDTQSAEWTTGEMLGMSIFVIIMLALFIFSIRIVVVTSRYQKQRKQAAQAMKDRGVTHRAFLQHVNGLPFAENVSCEVTSYRDRIEFKHGTTVVNLARSKITDMCIKTDVDIQKEAVSSIGRAAAGGAMFGPLGVIIGGRARTKELKTVTRYLIITYRKENETEEFAFIGFEISGNVSEAIDMVKEFRALNTNSDIRIDL